MLSRHAQVVHALNYTLTSLMRKVPQVPIEQIHTQATRTTGLFECLAASVYQGQSWKIQIENIGKIYQHLCPALVFPSDQLLDSFRISSKTSADTHRRIKVGFITKFLIKHSVGKVIGPIISLLDPQKFETYVFTKEGGAEDDATKLFTQTAQHVRLPLDGQSARHVIVGEQLDILVFAEVSIVCVHSIAMLTK